MTSRQAQVASLSAHLQVRPRNARAFSSCSATRGVMDRNALRLLTAANKRAAPCENRKREFSRIFNLVTHTDTAPAFSLATGQTHPPRVAQPEPDVPAPPLAFGEPARVRQQNTRLALRRPGPRVPSRRLASAQQPGRPRPPPDPQRERAFANLVASRARRDAACLAFPRRRPAPSARASDPDAETTRVLMEAKAALEARALALAEETARANARVAKLEKDVAEHARVLELERTELCKERDAHAATRNVLRTNAMAASRREAALTFSLDVQKQKAKEKKARAIAVPADGNGKSFLRDARARDAPRRKEKNKAKKAKTATTRRRRRRRTFLRSAVHRQVLRRARTSRLAPRAVWTTNPRRREPTWQTQKLLRSSTRHETRVRRKRTTAKNAKRSRLKTLPTR